MTFPGTVASLRQMWGRAGRRGRGLAIYVAGEDALDQFFCRHPDEFLERPVEAAILDPHNEQLYAAHLLCAAHEGPLYLRGRARPRARVARGRATSWWATATCGCARTAPSCRGRADEYPAGALSLRSAARDGGVDHRRASPAR